MNTPTATRPSGVRPASYRRGGRLLVGRFVTEAARNRVTLTLLVVVPIVFVALVGGVITDAGELLGGQGGPQAETTTAGWTAGFVAAVAMYFQVSSARAADRRLVLAGLPPARLVLARMTAGAMLALVAATASYVTLVLTVGGLDHPARVAVATLMFAIVYLALGALIGALVANPVNGTVLILFIWLIDVVFGPAFRPADAMVSRLFPTHYLSLWMMDEPSGHAGRPGDLGWALGWTAVAVALSWAVVAATSRTARTRTRTRPGSVVEQLAVGTRMGLREVGRNLVLWALLIAVPGLFVALSAFTTPDGYETMTVREAGREVAATFWFPDTHPGLMAPISVGALAAIVGLFTALGARNADRRLALAGFRPMSLIASRLAVVGVLAVVVTTASLAVTAAFFEPGQWGPYILANLLLALTYALVGVLVGWLFGRVGGVLVAFLIPFLDLAIEQSPMLNPELSTLAHLLPGYGTSRILYDAALTSTFDETSSLPIALGWLLALTVLVTGLLRHLVQSGRTPTRHRAPRPRTGGASQESRALDATWHGCGPAPGVPRESSRHPYKRGTEPWGPPVRDLLPPLWFARPLRTRRPRGR